jgi:hypothetical protein
MCDIFVLSALLMVAASSGCARVGRLFYLITVLVQKRKQVHELYPVRYSPA